MPTCAAVKAAATCVSPELFTSDDDGYCAERGTAWEVPAGIEDHARLAVDSCPEGAITLDET